MKEIRTEIEIAASAERVWQILTDFSRYPEWNPLVPEASGELQLGGRLRIRVVAGRDMRFDPLVVVLKPQRQLKWRGVTRHKLLLVGEHGFQIEPLGEDRVRFIQSEVFSGILSLLLGPLLERDARPAFERMNQALKARAEKAP